MQINSINNIENTNFKASFANNRSTKAVLKRVANEAPFVAFDALKYVEQIGCNDVISLSMNKAKQLTIKNLTNPKISYTLSNQERKKLHSKKESNS